MNRRGHLSKKIPQVKIRPAPARSGDNRQASPGSGWDEEREEIDIAQEAQLQRQSRKNAKPWKGVHLTFTGVENKAHLMGLARELGANTESALTKSVTHVVAVACQSAKYHYAVEHRIPVMTPMWIEDAHAVWLEGDDFDFWEMQEAHRLLPFEGLRIAMSGIEHLDRRRQIVDLINYNGGIYSKDLDKECTHLVSSKPAMEKRPSEKIKWALRNIADNEAARRRGNKISEDADIKIVYEEWVWDCVAYKGRWKETMYDARKPRRGGRVDPTDVINDTVNLPEPERRVVLETAVNLPDNFDASEPAAIKRRKEKGLDSLVGQIIPGISNGGGSGRSTPKRASPDVEEEPLAKRPKTVKSSMAHLSRTTSFAAEAERKPPARSKFSSTAVIEDVVGDVFEGLKMVNRADGIFDQVNTHLGMRGAILVSWSEFNAGLEVDYVIVRMDFKGVPEQQQSGQTKWVTENWVECCVTEEAIVDPNIDIFYRPLTFPTPLPALGFSLSESAASQEMTHLVTNQSNTHKMRRASRIGAKIVSIEWIQKMAETGKLEPWEDYQLRLPMNALSEPAFRRLWNEADDMSRAANEQQCGHDFKHIVSKTAREQAASAAGPSNGASSSGAETTRALRAHPTHIDRASPEKKDKMKAPAHPVPSAGGSARKLPTGIHSLSPEKQSTLLRAEALPLKAAESSPKVPTAASPSISIHNPSPAKSASSRAASKSPVKPSDLDIADVVGENRVLGQKESMTEVMRRLAERPSGSATKNPPRRARPSARLKTTASRSPAVNSPASNSTAGANPSPLSRPAWEEESMQYPDDPLRDLALGQAEESMQVMHMDPAGDKAKRRLYALLKKGEEST
ncbi:hypothetical protein L202_00668 [Cryptococcus amylolentus CBS 6039]|uniref:BRCT domain-containing protein n=2 Tax=Cryptococcus amylolentus TaxID=104669 RepID=A0A1E3I8H7_9TREE|nr:hypothetical protein L202_00668 [Cryptococcus amylolentus CBS 6039]ODN84798.1 hypothetical protein L202_00668 [Cryptococcus amylolentus CBS 6039]ODO11477.1 hypothetical protein I350_00257 [Cryptococcus amylolentus CBS 6273]